MAQASRDQNFVTTLLGVSSTDGSTPIVVYADPVTHRLLVDVAGGSGTAVNNETPSGAFDGVNTTFTLAHTPLAGTLLLFLNGQFQHPGVSADYTLSGDTITYNAAPSAAFSGLPFTAVYSY